MPLTTRPASTSRQGMTRTARLMRAGQRQGVLEREPALVERGADDGALDAVGDQAHQRREVGQLGDAARGHHRPVGGRADVAQQLEVRTLEHAVLVDVGDDVARAALGVEPGQHVVEVAAVAGPAARGQGAAADVEADRDPVAVLGDRGRAPLRLLERRGADVDPAAAGGHRRRQRLVVADPAAHLDLDVEGADDLGLELAVVAAPERRVEVDQVEPLRAGLLPAQGRLDRVAEVLLRAGHALHELDRLAVGDVDGGQQLEVAVMGILAGGEVADEHGVEQEQRSARRGRRPSPRRTSRGRKIQTTTFTATSTATSSRSRLAPALGQDAGRDAARAAGSQPGQLPACGRAVRSARSWPRPPGRPPAAAASRSRSARRCGALLAHAGSQALPPSCAAGRAPASPDFSGWNWVATAGRSRRRRRTGRRRARPRCTSGARVRLWVTRSQRRTP